jgi:hypothetical protein
MDDRHFGWASMILWSPNCFVFDHWSLRHWQFRPSMSRPSFPFSSQLIKGVVPTSSKGGFTPLPPNTITPLRLADDTKSASPSTTASRHCRPVTLSAHAAPSLLASHQVLALHNVGGSPPVAACTVHCTFGSISIRLITVPLNGSLLPHPAYC